MQLCLEFTFKNQIIKKNYVVYLVILFKLKHSPYSLSETHTIKATVQDCANSIYYFIKVKYCCQESDIQK